MKTNSTQISLPSPLVIGMIGCVRIQTTAQQPATPDPIAYRAQFVVESGKIRFFYPTLQLTPEQLEKVQAAQQAPRSVEGFGSRDLRKVSG